MSHRYIIGGIFIAAAVWIAYRLYRGLPIIPGDVIKGLSGLTQKIGGTPADVGGEDIMSPQDIAGDDAGQFQFDDNTAGDRAPGFNAYDEFGNFIPYGADIPQSVKERGGEGFNLGFVKENAIPVALGATAAGATIAAQHARSKFKKSRVSKQTFVKEKSGLIKRNSPTKVSSPSSARPKKVGVPFRRTMGTGPLRVPTTIAKTVPRVLPKTLAVSASRAAIPQAAKVAGVAGRVAGRVFLPLAVGLSVYDIASRAQQKGAQNLTAQDVAAAATGLGGLGLSKYLPEQVRAGLGTKLVDVPNSISQASQNLSSTIYNFFGGR